MGIDVEILRTVLAKAHNPLLWNLVYYPEVQSDDLMNISVLRQSTPVLRKCAVNFISEADVQTTKVSLESVQNVAIPTLASTLSRMMHAQGIMVSAVSSMLFHTESNTSLLSGASLPWRPPSMEAQKEAMC